MKTADGVVWGAPYDGGGNRREKYIYVDVANKSSNLYGSNFYAENAYTLKFSKMFLGKKSTDTDKPDANKPSDKPNVEKPSTDKPNVEKPSTDKPSVDNNKPVNKVDTNEPAVNNIDNAFDANKANAESNRPTVANRNLDVPKTSDRSNIMLYSMLLLSAITVTGIILKRRFRTE